MEYSDKLNGYWEEGYHEYVEIRDDKITVRDYRKSIELETTISYDAAALERGERADITFENNVLSTNLMNEPMSWLEDVYYENGEIYYTHAYSFNDDWDKRKLHKVENGPFDNIIIRDDEFLDKLQGVWKEWVREDIRDTVKGDDLVINGNSLSWGSFGGGKFHAVSYKGSYESEKVYLVPENLIDDNFSGFGRVEVKPDMLLTWRMVCDMSMPSTVFARAEMIDKIEIPESAKKTAVSTMMPTTPFPPLPTTPSPLNPAIPTANNGYMNSLFGMMDMNEVIKAQREATEKQLHAGGTEGFSDEVKESLGIKAASGGNGSDQTNEITPKFCPHCGQDFRQNGHGKFCYNCGGAL